jgi:hypothetical protein
LREKTIINGFFSKIFLISGTQVKTTPITGHKCSKPCDYKLSTERTFASGVKYISEIFPLSRALFSLSDDFSIFIL